ncbi:ubiquitin-protein ligase domain-containing protein [Cavenderia fasciculata]|uniref:Ubiquitin-protein ligase domain-containing protein n=1 Tax=Cavenderia fasciculata TaxID=261658 RepID=F4QCD5_CACFS|nr:ubiquitin-protein ligase domain-containing protein [Cavenderia fasciculata]EGG13570.1 ubiquitin-protein ligase domain-containing protein [Cavenderia fasciculata]|eukprot:XP_004350274.1 ubiquitin-protein ligase domain-containing protein [Cavenderia fasciculata]
MESIVKDCISNITGICRICNQTISCDVDVHGDEYDGSVTSHQQSMINHYLDCIDSFKSVLLNINSRKHITSDEDSNNSSSSRKRKKIENESSISTTTTTTTSTSSSTNRYYDMIIVIMIVFKDSLFRVSMISILQHEDDNESVMNLLMTCKDAMKWKDTVVFPLLPPIDTIESYKNDGRFNQLPRRYNRVNIKNMKDRDYFEDNVDDCAFHKQIINNGQNNNNNKNKNNNNNNNNNNNTRIFGVLDGHGDKGEVVSVMAKSIISNYLHLNLNNNNTKQDDNDMLRVALSIQLCVFDTSYENREFRCHPLELPDLEHAYIYRIDAAYFYPGQLQDYMEGKRIFPDSDVKRKVQVRVLTTTVYNKTSLTVYDAESNNFNPHPRPSPTGIGHRSAMTRAITQFKWLTNTAIETITPKVDSHGIKEIRESASLDETQKNTEIQALRIGGARVEDLCLDFVLPGYPDWELKPGGSKISITLDNLGEYINLILTNFLYSGVCQQIDAFKEGFNQIFLISSLGSFSIHEIESLLCGSLAGSDGDWTVESLMESTKCDHGFTNTSEPVQNFFKIVSEFNEDERKQFLLFITGSPHLPIQGFKGLSPRLTIVKKHHNPPYQPDDFLLSVMSCTNYIKLPHYSSKDIMKQKLLYAMKEGQSSFHLS